MANTYKNAAVVMTSTGATDLYSCPANTRAIVQSVNVANVDGSDRYVTVTWFDSSTAQNYTLLFNGFIPAGTALNALDVPLVLEPGDIVRVQASAANTLHATASILQSDPSTQYPDGSITETKLSDASVTTNKLADLSITTAKIASASVTSAKMAAGVSPLIICTSTTRPASPVAGQQIYETDLNRVRVWNGSAWGGLFQSSVSGSVLSFHGERNGPPGVGVVYAFGNGSTVGALAVPFASTLVGGSFLSDSTTNGTITVQVAKNGVAQGSGYQFSVTGASQSVSNIFSTPLALAAGDKFNVVCTAQTASAGHTNIILLMVLN